MTARTYTYGEAADLLVAEGWARADVTAVLDTAIDAGLCLPQPDDGWILDADEIDLVRGQLRSYDPETAS